MKPMLAAKIWVPEQQRYPVLASPKLDGIRALNVDGNLVSRRLKPIPNHYLRKKLSGPVLSGWDGELVSGNFQNTTSAVMSRDGIPDVKWWVFDSYIRKGPFVERLLWIRDKLEVLKPDLNIQVVNHVTLKSEEEVLEYEISCLSKGFEGIMLRDPEGPYKFGRSTMREGWLIKIKRFDDDEATIIGTEELLHNDNEAERNALGNLKRSSAKSGMVPMNVLGAMVVENKKFGQFNVGTGFSADQRRTWWQGRKLLVGRRIKFKYQKHGTKDKPRIPVFLGFRED